MSSPRVAVVGGGISGLAAGHRLRTLLPGATVTVLEQRDRLGGVLRTVDLAGLPYDVGAEAFLWRRPEVRDLLDELGLAGEVVHPAGATPSVRAGGATVALPSGTLLGVPTSAARLDGVLSPAGVAAAVSERDRALSWTPGDDVALGALLRERFGDELADRLADPLLGGVYAGRVDALGLRATLPAIAAALDAGAPSLTAAADRATAAADRTAGLPVFGALRGGYATLVDALAVTVDVRLSITVRALHRLADGWRLVLGPGQDDLEVDAVVLAVPAPAVARLLVDVSPAVARAAGGIELASSVVVALAYRDEDAAALPPTSGVLVAAGEPVSIKAATHSSRKWSHLSAAATDGLVRLRTSLGRFGEEATIQVDDAELVARSRTDLEELAGITAAPVAAHVQRWGGGLPQYGVGHVDRVRVLEDAVAGVPGLAIAGAALHGVGVPACVGTARAAAERVATQLAAAPVR